ncbi:ribosome biogenesis protein [Candidatus Micrarchaeota archaeon]|nr:ribosome biogenesis protein [Candidatus Micrarchaeota archaeon]
MKRLRRCATFHYSLHEVCPRCGQPTVSAHPPKYSPHDPYADIRRREKYG